MWDLSACCLEKCSCARGRRRKTRSFVQNQQVTLVPVQMFACCIPLPSPGELWATARLGNLWIVTPVVNMMLGLKWLQGVTGQPASAACLDSCPGGKSPSLWAALQSGCSISAVVLFKVLLFHFTLSGGSFCQPHWSYFIVWYTWGSQSAAWLFSLNAFFVWSLLSIYPSSMHLAWKHFAPLQTFTHRVILTKSQFCGGTVNLLTSFEHIASLTWILFAAQRLHPLPEHWACPSSKKYLRYII